MAASGPKPTPPPVGTRWHRPQTQRFRALSILWIFPSLGALLILALNWPVWRDAGSIQAALGATRFEQWVAAGLLLTHPVLVVLARHHGRTERPVPLPPDEAEPETDCRSEKNPMTSRDKSL